MTRQQHMEWAKQRALEYVDKGDAKGALASMFSDLRKHAETSDHIGIELGMMLMMAGDLATPSKVRKFIEDFN